MCIEPGSRGGFRLACREHLRDNLHPATGAVRPPEKGADPMSIPPDSRRPRHPELPSAHSTGSLEANAHRQARRAPTGRSHAKGRGGGSLLGSVPAVRKSYVVEIAPAEGNSSEITARIRPTEQAAVALVDEGFRLSDTILDLVSELLVEIAREEEEDDDP